MGLGLGIGIPFFRRALESSFFDEFGIPELGYSTMALGASENQTETRRSSDDATQDDTAAQIQSRLLSWVNTDDVRYTSDFSAGTDGMTATNGALDAPVTFSGKDDVLKFEADATFAAHGVAQNAILNADGSQVRFQGDIYIPSTNSVIDGARIWSGQFGDGVQVISTLDEWVTFDFTINNDNGSNFVVWGLDGTDFQFSASGDVFYLKNIVVTQETADGLIRTLYGIGSTGLDIQQTTASRQPEIVVDGTLQEIDSDPAILFSDTKSLSRAFDSTFIPSNTLSVDIDFETGSDVSSIQTLVGNRDASNQMGLVIFVGRLYLDDTANGGYVSIAANTRYKATLVWNGTTFSAAYLNGVSASITYANSGALGSLTTNFFQVGGNASSTTRSFLGKIATLLIYNEAKDLAHNIGFTNAY